jgi:hypothetical protein
MKYCFRTILLLSVPDLWRFYITFYMDPDTRIRITGDRISDPDPALFFSGFQDDNKILVFC